MLADTTHAKVAVLAAGHQFLETALALELGVQVIKKSNNSYDCVLPLKVWA
jgi:hypothetical protein